MKLNSLNHSHARKNFCLDKQTQKLIKLYKDILKKFLIIDYSLNLEM